MNSFRELLVWQKAFDLCLEVYSCSRLFPSNERYGLTSELRKTARSVVCNISEGHERSSRVEFVRFLQISLASAAELETQLLLARALGYLNPDVVDALMRRVKEVERMTAGLQKVLRNAAALRP